MHAFKPLTRLPTWGEVDKTVKTRERKPKRQQRHGNARLTDGEVELIRKLSDEGMTDREIALKFDISRMQAYRLTRYLSRPYLYL